MMMLLWSLIGLLAAAAGTPTSTRWSSNYNDNFDSVIRRVQLYGPQLGLDPMKLPDIDRTVSVNVLFEEVSMGLENTQGVLTGATTLRRNGNATVSIEGSAVYISADVDFVTLNYEYASRAKFLGLQTAGRTSGTIDDLLLHLTLKVDLSNPNQADEQLVGLVVKSTGGLTIHFDNGMGILDQFLDALSDSFTATFKDVVISYVKPEIEKAVENAIQKIEGNDINP